MGSPKYEIIRQSLSGAIASGEYQPGQHLPSESDLVKAFAEPRPTVIRALRELQMSGAIERRVGSGSYVRSDSVARGYTFDLLIPKEIDSSSLKPNSSDPVKSDRPSGEDLSLQIARRMRVVALGEVLWDVFPNSSRLGGAPLNFGAHARRLGHEVCLVSAVGVDDLGRQAVESIAAFRIDTTFLQAIPEFPTGTAAVELISGDKTLFNIHRPAAYDAIRISDSDIQELSRWSPGWLYYGTVFASTHNGRNILKRILNKLDETVKFYDLNLRPGCDSPALVNELLEWADVVKLNEEELRRVHEYTSLPLSYEKFCREAAVRYGLKSVAVTLGDRGCAMLANGHYVERVGLSVEVADPVGAGDAFAAAFMHGLSLNWPVAEIAAFANRVGALVASREGAIPDWTLEEAVNQ